MNSHKATHTPRDTSLGVVNHYTSARPKEIKSAIREKEELFVILDLAAVGRIGEDGTRSLTKTLALPGVRRVI
jgi:anti-anti-sigma regulatory factor